LRQKPRFLAVLDAVAEHAKWGRSRDGRFQGIAINEAAGSVCAQVVEVSVSIDGDVRVHRVISAIDAGHIVNPLTVELQTESAVAYALSAALYGEITVQDGRVEQSNFHDYKIVRMSEMPKVETVIVPSTGVWGGIGEPPVAPLAPALCNAIFAATGTRVRSLPITRERLRKA
jgi:isoquinoline 1-oxidoreductase beta subunit